MKVYHITETKPAYQVWYYSVEAESEEKALEMIKNGETKPSDYEIVDEPEVDSTLTVIAETEPIVVQEEQE